MSEILIDTLNTTRRERYKRDDVNGHRRLSDTRSIGEKILAIFRGIKQQIVFTIYVKRERE